MSTNNPYAPPNAESGQAIPAPVPQGKWLKGLIPLQFVVLVFAIGFAAWNIESIMVSGPILSLIGIIIGGFAGWFRNWLACLYGVSALTLALFVFALIADLISVNRRLIEDIQYEIRVNKFTAKD